VLRKKWSGLETITRRPVSFAWTQESPKPRETLQKAGFPQLRDGHTGVESIWPPKCGVVVNPLSGKDFEHNVEAHESTCDTRPASGAGAPDDDIHADHGTHGE
jgi:hypothetical protein